MENLKNLTIDVPQDVENILNTIHRAGYEAYVVGGCVRDQLLGKSPDDWDITTSALPEQVKSLFNATVDTGIQHGTVMVIKNGRGYEVTTYRVDGEYKDGRHPESVQFTRSLEEDLKRRDFTINAFAYSPQCGIIDMFKGISDLQNGIIRAVGNPRKRFDEDALRIMRAIRFAAQLSFEIEPETLAAISEFAPKLDMVSAERIRVEFEKTLYSENPDFVNMFKDLGLASFIVPNVSESCFLRRSEPLYANMKGKAATEDEKYVRLAAFFMGLSVKECKTCMRKMTFDNRSRDMVSGILEHIGIAFSAEPLEARKQLRKIGLKAYQLELDFAKCSGKSIERAVECLEGIIERKEVFELSQLAVTGADLITAGVPQGVKIGETLNMMLDAVVENPSLNDKEKLLEML